MLLYFFRVFFSFQMLQYIYLFIICLKRLMNRIRKETNGFNCKNPCLSKFCSLIFFFFFFYWVWHLRERVCVWVLNVFCFSLFFFFWSYRLTLTVYDFECFLSFFFLFISNISEDIVIIIDRDSFNNIRWTNLSLHHPYSDQLNAWLFCVCVGLGFFFPFLFTKSF